MKRALVTGGSGEIGAAICRQLSAQGMHVLVHAHRNTAGAQEIVEEILRTGGSAEHVNFDVSDGAQCEEVLDKVLADGPVQVIVSNAGYHDDAPMAGMNAGQWYGVIDTCLNGFYNICQPLLLPMIRTRWGRIIAVSSIAGVKGNRGQANYAAAKAGLHGAVKSLSIELASRGITANAVAPGIIATRMSEAAFSREMIEALVPARRAGSPDEVASLVAFLASEDAAYISGQVVEINGGIT